MKRVLTWYTQSDKLWHYKHPADKAELDALIKSLESDLDVIDFDILVPEVELKVERNRAEALERKINRALYDLTQKGE